jgi:hypothetical protein
MKTERTLSCAILNSYYEIDCPGLKQVPMPVNLPRSHPLTMATCGSISVTVTIKDPTFLKQLHTRTTSYLRKPSQRARIAMSHVVERTLMLSSNVVGS